MRIVTLWVVCIVAVAATPTSFDSQQRIIGGSATTIEKWPYQANVMFQNVASFAHNCGGVIINNRSVLTAAHCIVFTVRPLPPSSFRLRLGSSFASSGGHIHHVADYIYHPNYNSRPLDTDIGIFHSATSFVYSNAVQRAVIAGPNYNLRDNEEVWLTGWGSTVPWNIGREQLQEVQVWTINQGVCAQLYGGTLITENMLCTGSLEVGGADSCQGDSGGPVSHNRVVVGIISFGVGCGRPTPPGVNARVSRFTSWIQANA